MSGTSIRPSTLCWALYEAPGRPSYALMFRWRQLRRVPIRSRVWIRSPSGSVAEESPHAPEVSTITR